MNIKRFGFMALVLTFVMLWSCNPPAPTTAPPASGTPAQATPEPAKTPVEPAAAPAEKTPPAAPQPAQPKEEGKAPAKTAPPAAPAPSAKEPVIKTLPAGTVLELEILDGVSSKTSKVGDAVKARLAVQVERDGEVVIPKGAQVSGEVTEAVALKKIGGQAKLGLDFSRLEMPNGGTAVIHATLVEIGKSETKKDAAVIGGSAAGGALLGRLLSRDNKTKGTIIGAVVGAAAGTAVAAKTKGQEIELPAGSVLKLKLDQDAQIPVNR